MINPRKVGIAVECDFEPNQEVVQSQMETLLKFLEASGWRELPETEVALLLVGRILSETNGWGPVRLVTKEISGESSKEIMEELKEALANDPPIGPPVQ